uniref:Uncharacterized protein MANES_13G037200 n=1 Tax=Rhizophora mucronata TaxID=61149 RepID=A0A2P2KC68_RHIMU
MFLRPIPLCSINAEPNFLQLSLTSSQNPFSSWTLTAPCVLLCRRRVLKPLLTSAVSRKSDSEPDPESSSKPSAESKPRPRRPKAQDSQKHKGVESSERIFTLPRKPRRGRRSEAAAVEDYVRDTLERTFAAIRQRNPENVLENNHEKVLKDRVDDKLDSETDSEDDDDEENGEDEGEDKKNKKKMMVEEESPSWPLDAEVGWGIRASEYFDQYPIKNVVGEDGMEIDWEGELDDNWVKEINCLEWESFAFHPSPLIVLVFERYNRASDNWKTLKELEKAARVYWRAKDRLPPRTVKIDINIERDLAYALKVKECPQILFLRGNRILYREKGEMQ